jgi:hypothetical protein
LERRPLLYATTLLLEQMSAAAISARKEILL